MAKQRSGYVYEETAWYAVVNYQQSGKPQKIKRRAKSRPHAKQLAEKITLKLKEQLGPKIKTRKSATAESAGWYARVTYTDDAGKRKNVKQRAENKTAAKEAVKRIIRDLDDHGPRTLDAAQMTFAHLADYYKENYLIEPEYVDGRKVAGLRSYYGMRIRLDMLKDHFGRFKLRAITHGDLKRFRSKRLKTPTKHDKQRSITTVNRELQVLRRALNVALSNGWIKHNPFEMGDSLITPGDERKRERILTRDEEDKLLAACAGRRAHLRPIVICALDTGMRKGEILKLIPADLDFDNQVITVRAFNTKTMRARQVAMSRRLARELAAIVERLPADADVSVFGITDDFKKAFYTARKDAGLPELRFHDLRHTYATRLVAHHLPLAEVGRALGHTQANTTYRYVNANVETARRAAALIDEFNESVDDDESRVVN